MNKFLKLSEEELVEILKRGDLNQQDFLLLKEAMEHNGLTGMMMCVGGDFDNDEDPEEAIKEYIAYHEKISKKISKKEIERLKKVLFLKTVTLVDKKIALASLAHLADQTVFEVLKKFHECPDNELRVWSELAFQECRSFFKSKVFGEPGITIGSLSGIKDNRMRFYFIFKTLDDEIVNFVIKKTMNESLNEAVDLFDCEIEQAKFGVDHMMLTVLLPFDVPPAEFAEAVVAFGNRDSFIWHGDFYVNNTHLPKAEEIKSFVSDQLSS